MRPINLLAFLCLTVTVCGQALAAGCPGKPNTLGVSRVLQIDTNGGPLYGRLQYKEKDPLADKEVVLTFDDGPLRRNTRKVLAALAAHCTKATFFMVGQMAVSDPAMVREVAAAGHTIGGHTWSHQNLKRYSGQRAAGEIELGVSAVERALGRPIAPFFRFPYLADPKSMIGYLKSRNVAMFSIDVDSYDYKSGSGDRMRRNVMRQLAGRKKGIILMHDIQRATARGIRGLLNELKSSGYKVVHLVGKGTLKGRPEYNLHASALLKKRRTSARAKPLTDAKFKWASAAPQLLSSKTGTAQAGSTARRRRTAAAKNPKGTRKRPYAAKWKRSVLGLD